MNGYVFAVTVTLVAAALWTDWRRLEIPNGLTFSYAAAGIGYQVVTRGFAGLGWTLAGAAAGMLPLLVLYLMKGMGAGDVKWFAAFGAWAGAAAALQLVVGSILCAGAIALLLVLMRLPGLKRFALKVHWPWGVHPAAVRKGAKFPFMVAVAPAYLILCWGGL